MDRNENPSIKIGYAYLNLNPVSAHTLFDYGCRLQFIILRTPMSWVRLQQPTAPRVVRKLPHYDETQI
jgi:hypothetical protein